MTFLELVQQYFPEEEWGNALAVIEGESQGNPFAINNTAYPEKPGYHTPGRGYRPEYSVGLFQINTLAWPNQAAAFNLLDPVQNVQVAAIIYKLLGWSPWSVAKAKGITAGRSYSVSESSIANKVVPGAAPSTPAPTSGTIDTPGSGSVGEVGGVVGTMQSTADALQWLGVNAGALVMRATLMGVGSVIVLMGLYFLVRSL